MPLEEIIAADGNKIIARFFAPGREARGRRLRKVGDLPKGVMQQWRRWCLNPEYAVGAEGESVRAQYAAVRTPVVYVNAPRKMKRIAPQDSACRASATSASSGRRTDIPCGGRTCCPN